MPTSSSTVSLHEPVIWAIKVMIHPVYGCIGSYMIASDVDGHLHLSFKILYHQPATLERPNPFPFAIRLPSCHSARRRHDLSTSFTPLHHQGSSLHCRALQALFSVWSRLREARFAALRESTDSEASLSFSSSQKLSTEALQHFRDAAAGSYAIRKSHRPLICARSFMPAHLF